MSLSMYLLLRFAPKNSIVAEIHRNCPKSYETGTKNTILGTPGNIRFLGRGADVTRMAFFFVRVSYALG